MYQVDSDSVSSKLTSTLSNTFIMAFSLMPVSSLIRKRAVAQDANLLLPNGNLFISLLILKTSRWNTVYADFSSGVDN